MDSNVRPIQHWLRAGRDPFAAALRRAGTTAVGTYAAYVAYGVAHPALRAPSDGPEAAEALPGDDLVDAPQSDKTFVVDVDAPPARVWPLLVQMGYGRAGWYGWYPLENGGRGSAPGVVPALQQLAVGDAIPDGPRADEGLGIWRVVELAPPHTLVLFSRRVAVTGREIAAGAPVDEPTIECSWAFVVRARDAGSRLIVRVRARYHGVEDTWGARLARRFFDLGDTVMEWTMVAGIKARAERAA